MELIEICPSSLVSGNLLVNSYIKYVVLIKRSFEKLNIMHIVMFGFSDFHESLYVTLKYSNTRNLEHSNTIFFL